MLIRYICDDSRKNCIKKKSNVCIYLDSGRACDKKSIAFGKRIRIIQKTIEAKHVRHSNNEISGKIR